MESYPVKGTVVSCDEAKGHTTLTRDKDSGYFQLRDAVIFVYHPSKSGDKGFNVGSELLSMIRNHQTDTRLRFIPEIFEHTIDEILEVFKRNGNLIVGAHDFNYSVSCVSYVNSRGQEVRYTLGQCLALGVPGEVPGPVEELQQ